MEVSLPTTVLVEVYLDPELCNCSRVCVDQCPMGVFVYRDGSVYPWNSSICRACFLCNDFCPNNAICTRWIVRA